MAVLVICEGCGCVFCPDPPDAAPGAVISPFCTPACRRESAQRRREERAAAERKRAAKRGARGRCPDCGKRRYATVEAAERVGQRYAAVRGGVRGVYECGGWYHVTSKHRTLRHLRRTA